MSPQCLRDFFERAMAGIGYLPEPELREPGIGNAGRFSQLGPMAFTPLHPIAHVADQFVHALPSHNSAKSASRILRGALSYAFEMPKDYKGPDVNELIVENLLKILANRKPETYCGKNGDRERLVYVTGGKKGRPVAPRALRYAVEGVNAPRLDLIAAIAHKEGLQPYQLLFEDFDPKNAPVVVTAEQEALLQRIRENFKEKMS